MLTMDRTTLAQELCRELEKMVIIDAHEHLPSEQDRLASEVDALTMFSHYCKGDLAAAGMKADTLEFVFSKAPLEQRWAAFKPYYQQICNSTYARAAHIAIERFYGEERLCDANLLTLSERIKANNTSGLYKRVLREACGIETCLTQGADHPCDEGLMTPVHWTINNPRSYADIQAQAKSLKMPIETLDDLLKAAAELVRRIKQDYKGVGFKFFVFPMQRPDRVRAEAAFRNIRDNPDQRLPLQNALSDIFFDAIFAALKQHALVGCIHTGYWGDFRDLHPAFALYMLDNYPEVNFDLYHVGYPYVREAIMMGKTRRNVWLNMCWTYLISPGFAAEALAEILEMVPANKIIGFGGDYFVVEKVYGHLVIARKVIANVLAGKVADKDLTFDGAVAIARKMLYDNPKALYSL